MGLAKRKPKHWHREELPPNVPNIFRAAEANDVPALKIALEHYNINDVDEDNMTALHWAAAGLANEAIDFLLSVEGIDPTKVDRFGRTADAVSFRVWHNKGEAITNKLRPFCHPWMREKSEPDLRIVPKLDPK